MIAQIPADIQSVLPAKWAAYASAAVVLVTMIGRAVTAIKNDGGLKAIWNSIVFGSSTTTQAAPNNAPAVPPEPSTLPKSVVALILLPGLCIGLCGCQGTVGLTGLNLSGNFASGGKVIDAGLAVGSNSFTVDGLVSGIFGLGTNKVQGSATIPVK